MRRLIKIVEAIEESSENPWVFHNTTQQALAQIRTEGMTNGSFAIRPIRFGGDVWLAVRRSDLPKPVQEHDYGGAWTYEPSWEPTTDSSTWQVIPADRIYLATARGRIIGPINERSPITEGRDAPLYHHMRYEKAIAVFASDTMPGRWMHNVPGMKAFFGNSFTRNPRLAYPADVILTIDQRRLSQAHRIIPLDGEYVHSYTQKGYREFGSIKDRHDNRWGRGQTHLMSEEFVVGDIENLHRYVTDIHVTGGMVDSAAASMLLRKAREYEARYGVPVHHDADLFTAD